jgi:hypothetical protein
MVGFGIIPPHGLRSGWELYLDYETLKLSQEQPLHRKKGTLAWK